MIIFNKKKKNNIKHKTFSKSSSLVGDLKALFTAVNHEEPPFFPIRKRKQGKTQLHLQLLNNKRS